MNKKVVGLRVTNVVELNHPIETDIENIENISEDLKYITDEIFDNVSNIICELGHNYKYGVGAYIYEGEEPERFKR